MQLLNVQFGVTNVKFSLVMSCQEGGDLFVVFGVVDNKGYHYLCCGQFSQILCSHHLSPASAKCKVRGNFLKSSEIVKKRLDFLCCLHLGPRL